MKAVRFVVIGAVAAMIGCAPADPAAGNNSPVQPCAFGAARIRIIGLTRILARSTNGKEAVLTACVDVLDSYNSHIKAPGRFRFELYEFTPRSSEPRGKRLMIWPDVDLTDPGVNNEYWQDYLRTYQFTFEMDHKPGDNTFILEATCITPAGKRLTDVRQIFCE